ncbi:MAG: exodeoxyribonuclease V alpha subunit [Myxococcota bacterium]
MERDSTDDIRAIISRMISERIPKAFGMDPRSDVQVLTPMHRGPLGSEGINEMLGQLLNPGRGRVRLAPGDKVMQIRNNYDKEVFNGDVGFIEGYANDERTLLVAFDEPGGGRRMRHYDPADQEQLVPAWAISIHKSQGSEYPAVVIPLHTQHYMMLRRNLVYTAVTRGKRLVVLVGSRRALQMAVSAGSVRRRHGRLADRLRELVA